MGRGNFQFGKENRGAAVAPRYTDPQGRSTLDPQSVAANANREAQTKAFNKVPLINDRGVTHPNTTYTTYALDFSAQQASRVYRGRCNLVFFNYSSDFTAFLKIRIGNMRADEIYLMPGASIRGIDAEEIWVGWSSVIVAGIGQLMTAFDPRNPMQEQIG